ncbi:hypothetical protein [Aeromonas veronii]|uniref:hypothetical protein n=1 Tax=Aeromonas veronii TaxID=654 RepID=UPI00226C922E|nr:hypothetical protein [Aeromonas veronii]MCX9105558.1 hypothetical protein [Aeromonas veronii]MCX9121195.1 hypothetical protein [Aeromonas veronii]
MKVSLTEEKEDLLTDKMKKDSEFQSKRKQLIVVSILLMAISLSDAQLKEANTFIFKIDFSNTAAFGWMMFFGVIVLIIRYYSFAFKYHSYLYDVWANAMMKDRRVLVYYFDDNSCDYIPHGLLSKLKDHSCSSNIDGHSFEKYKVEPKYKVNGILKRGITYDYDSGYDITTEEVNLNEFHACWTKRDLYELLKVEFEHQKDAIFRRPEYLDISLPYFIATLSLICFIFKYQILYLLAL